MRRPGSALLLTVLLVTACNQAEPTTPSGKTPSTAATPAAAPLPAAPRAPTSARSVAESTPLYEFDYAYPAAAAAIPPLKAWLEADLARQHRELEAEAREGKADSVASAFPFSPYSRSLDWKVVADLPGWLSLSSLYGTFSGGAHPNYSFQTLLWDRQASQRREPLDLFTSAAALDAAIRTPFCNLLDQQRAKKRGAPVNRASGDEFDACIDPAKETVILGSSNHRNFDRIGVLVAPYDAGPYAEGDYEVTLPVTAAVLAAVKPEYRASFAIAR